MDRRRLDVLPVLDTPFVRSVSQTPLRLWSGALVVLPVFLQAPWVRIHPFSASLFTIVLMAVAIPLGWQQQPVRKDMGALLLGFSGSWLAGSLFWGWLRAHPSWHLPIEALALPLAITGLGGRWRLGCTFYLSSLIGTALTDLAMALTGVMRFWPAVVQAPLAEANTLLNTAAASLRHPSALLVMLGLAALILGMANQMHMRSRRPSLHSDCWAVAASVLVTTLMVDGLFLLMAMLQPALSGLI